MNYMGSSWKGREGGGSCTANNRGIDKRVMMLIRQVGKEAELADGEIKRDQVPIIWGGLI